MKKRHIAFVAALAAALGFTHAAASGQGKFEIWAIDQSNSPGQTFGGTVYIYDGHDLERGRAGAAAVPERIDLGGAAAALCLSKTGANSGPPAHARLNAAQSHRRDLVRRVRPRVFIDAANARTPWTASAPPSARAARDRPTSRCRRPTIATSASPTRTASSTSASTPITPPTRSCSIPATASTSRMHHAQRCRLPGCRHPARQRADLPCHRIHQPLQLRHAPRRRHVRRRRHDHSDDHRGRVRHRRPSTERLPRRAGRRQDVHRFGRRHAGQPVPGRPLHVPGRGFSALNPINTPAPAVVFSEDGEEGADAHGAALTKHQQYLWVADRAATSSGWWTPPAT